MSCSSCPISPKRTNPNMMIQLVPGEIKKPEWLKVRAKLPNERYMKIRRAAHELKLATVCEEAMCPNIGECWGGGTATFMLMGDTCTRACRFCNVNHGKPQVLDPDEPRHLAEAIGQLDLDYAVITCVDRDDVPDGGASHFATCISYLRTQFPKLLVEVLASDFQGKEVDIKKVVDSQPHVYGHNIETVERLTPSVRDQRASYRQSLGVLKYVKTVTSMRAHSASAFGGSEASQMRLGAQASEESGFANSERSRAYNKMYTKSSIMVGLGEKPEEVIAAMEDLRAVDVDFLTIGQYLRPTAWNLKVCEYVPPEQFKTYEEKGLKLGFKYVAAGPYVRSSYKAGELFIKNVITNRKI